jgi:hypothetical protein
MIYSAVRKSVTWINLKNFAEFKYQDHLEQLNSRIHL